MSQTGAQIVTGLIPSEPIISNNNAESYVSADPACGLLGHFIWDFWGALIGLVTFVSLDARLIFQTSQSIQGGRLINYQVAHTWEINLVQDIVLCIFSPIIGTREIESGLAILPF